MRDCRGRLSVERRESDGLNIAPDLFATYPLRLHLTEKESDKALLCYILGFGGGLVAGDSLNLSVTVKARAAALLTSQSTSKVFRARNDRPTTNLSTNLVVEQNGLLVWVPQPLQCFAKSQVKQNTRIELPSEESSLLFLDWYTGGRKKHDDGGWHMDCFENLTTIIDCTGDNQFRDATLLSGGVELQRHMRHFQLVAMMVLVGPQVKKEAKRLLDLFSSRRSYEEHKDDDNLNYEKGLIVSCGTFPIHGDATAGVVVRILATSVEQAASFLSVNVGTLGGKLGEDPFHEILVLRGGSGIMTPPQGTNGDKEKFTQPALAADLLAVSWRRSQPKGSASRSGPVRSLAAVYQLVDSSTPTGGFAHSNTIEVAWQLHVFSEAALLEYCWDVLMQTISTAVPFLSASCDCFMGSDNDSCIEEWLRIDKRFSCTMTSHVSRRASCVQGSGMIRAFAVCYPTTATVLMKLKKHSMKTGGGHAATCFGAICGLLDITPEQSASMFLYITARDMVNAAVRMNLVGPLEGGRLIQTLCQESQNVLQDHNVVNWPEPYGVTPVVEVLANAHDRLYTRLFNSI